MSTPLSALIVEDSEDDALLLLRELKRGGYEITSERVDTAEAMRSALAKQKWDIIFCDYAMPHFSAFAALELFKETDLDVPFIIISGAIGEETAVAAMKAGVHDYIMKGNLSRLVPAVERELREAKVRRERKKVQEQLEHSFIDLAQTVSRAMASRDPYTAGHEKRVADLARLVGKKMGLEENRLQGLYIGGLLHDIGKISTPESILSKPGELTDEEWNLIRAHTKRGYEILKDTYLPWPVADMAVHHHERLDGSGYPHGISGDKLSLEVRILAVCDVVEAMSSHRPYRPARSKKEVLEEIKGGRGTKYDANVVDVMLQIIENEEFQPFSTQK
jgi:putative nucleotidyltransferase with HDIG domain